MVVSTEQNLTILDSNSLEYEQVIVGFNDEVIDLKYSKSDNPTPFILLVTNSSIFKLLKLVDHSVQTLVKGHQDIVLCGEYYHPYIITGSKDKTIKLWLVDELGRVRTIANYSGHSDDVCGIGFMK